MPTIDFKEDQISQIPALQMLIKLGYEYLSPIEALQYRDNKTTHVILEDILRKQLREINSIQTGSSKLTLFSGSNIEAGITALKNIPFNEGYITATQHIYDLLTLGKTLEQSIDGDKKSFNLKYIDWEHPERNVFHVTEEFSVMRSGSKEHYRPDIVLFVNGIPLSVIECKRPDMKNPLGQAISQHIRNQQEDGIRQLYAYSQLNLAIATDDAMYGTAGTPEKFRGHWKEKFEDDMQEHDYQVSSLTLKQTSLNTIKKNKIFGERSASVREYFEQLESEALTTVQDDYLISLCKPQRLLDLSFGYIVYDNNIKKIARYQQYFAIKKTVKKVSDLKGGKREGGVIWHTQGSGKSLTMVMLAEAIASVKTIRNPKIIIVTDRTDLDKQISDTFKKCGRTTHRASTGQNLVESLESKSDAIVTTVINKFVAAVKKIKKPLESHDIFVLIDEGHRTQYGDFNMQMRRTLPNACFIAMTGTPLMKKEKSTANKFGGIIDSYTVDEAVADKAVVPLLYEGRHAKQQVDGDAMDRYFARIGEDLSESQKADLKRKFARADQLNIADRRIYEIAWDISLHYRANWQGTGFKGQLVCPNKISAIKYKKYLDEIGIITSDVIISPPDDREGEEDVFEKSEDVVQRFWDAKMNEFGKNAKKYEENVISRFKHQEDPEIIIVVDKLLTGFDEPKNVVLYLTRNLKGHTLLQAIARVNRVAENKEFGYIIDYYGVLGELDNAIQTYSSQGFDLEDVQHIMSDVDIEIQNLPQRYSDLWAIFRSISNKSDLEAFQQLLKDEPIRNEFYEKLREYGKTLKVALSSTKFYDEVEEKKIDAYKADLLMFYKLRQTVAARYSDEIDYKKYESQIQKLIDTHIHSDEVKTIVELVNIFEKEKFDTEVSKVVGEAAKADTIASRTNKYIQEKMEEDPAFYKKFSEMLIDTIKDYEDRRINEKEYHQRVKEIMENVLLYKDDSIPNEIHDNNLARSIYGVSKDFLQKKGLSGDKLKNICLFVAINAEKMYQEHRIVHRQKNTDIINKIKLSLFDMIYDEVKIKENIAATITEIDLFVDSCLGIIKQHK